MNKPLITNQCIRAMELAIGQHSTQWQSGSVKIFEQFFYQHGISLDSPLNSRICGMICEQSLFAALPTKSVQRRAFKRNRKKDETAWCLVETRDPPLHLMWTPLFSRTPASVRSTALSEICITHPHWKDKDKRFA